MYRHINVSQSNDVSVVRFAVDRINSDRVIADIGHDFDQFVHFGMHKLIINFRGVTSFTSGMTNKLLLLRKQLQEVGGRLRLCNLSAPMMEAFKTFGFLDGKNPIFDVRATLEEAITTDPWEALVPDQAK